ncbi:hypothetical protein Pint_24368 [Pistacia integerrima]|uniref:Uncharacterized protein n=1 Tax=Pistacia integerrima TaxID=434235 RepID=A0ACC0YAQ1_9ROSI|nr:hypothetical protein Pint_24368 [Pistacia integerrima]
MATFRTLSTGDVIRVAIARYLKFDSEGSVDLSWLNRVCGSIPGNLSEEDVKDVELMHCLLVSAEKIGSLQFDSASTFLNQCEKFSSKYGSSVQRIVHYFTEALREKFDRETGRITSKGAKGEENMFLYPEVVMVNLKPALFGCFLEIPLYQAIRFAGMQAIIESVAAAKRVHLIDLEIRCGAHCMLLMQALATQHEPQVELLTITAVGTTLRHEIEETGKTLAYFAKTLNLPFSFKVVMVTSLKDLNENLFELHKGEVVAIYSSITLNHMIRWPNCLESVIRVLKNTNPQVMVVTEIEANDNLLSFEDRFFEILFYYSTSFDCMEDCMSRSDQNRMMVEELLGQAIRNIIANEGEERIVRHMKIDAWRAFFSSFGLVETELSMSSLYQAELVVKNFACGKGKSCTFEKNGKSLIVGWKGSPHLSLSVWKFH